jgi:hypothetical protein
MPEKRASTRRSLVCILALLVTVTGSCTRQDQDGPRGIGDTAVSRGTVAPNSQPRKVAEIFNEGSISRDGRFLSYWDVNVPVSISAR